MQQNCAADAFGLPYHYGNGENALGQWCKYTRFTKQMCADWECSLNGKFGVTVSTLDDEEDLEYELTVELENHLIEICPTGSDKDSPECK